MAIRKTLTKPQQEHWEKMVYQAGAEQHNESPSQASNTILAVNRYIHHLERTLQDRHTIAALLQKAKKGEL